MLSYPVRFVPDVNFGNGGAYLDLQELTEAEFSLGV